MVRRDEVIGRHVRKVESYVKLGHGLEEDYDFMADFAWTPDERVRHDKIMPISRPDYRVGQVWAWRRLLPEADGHLIEALPEWQFRVLHTDSEVNAVETGHSPLFGSLWRMDGPDAKNKVCATFLLHDLLRPDLAPWSSA